MSLTRNTYLTNKAKNYTKVIGKEGMVGIDAEWNELQDNIYGQQRKFLNNLLNKVMNSGMLIQALDTPAVDFKVIAGDIFIPELGIFATLQADTTYLTQKDWVDNVITNPTALTVVSGTRTDLVYLEVSITEITENVGDQNVDGFLGDDYLIDPDFGQGNCIREKIVLFIKVAEGSSSVPANAVGKYNVPLALINRTPGAIQDSMIENLFDERMAQDIFKNFGLQKELMQNCLIGENTSLPIIYDGGVNTLTIEDIQPKEFLLINGIMFPNGRINNYVISFVNPLTTGFYNIVLKIKSTDLTLDFIRKPIADGILADEFLVTTHHWDSDDSDLLAGLTNEFLGYGDGIKKVFSFNKTLLKSNSVKVKINGGDVSPAIDVGTASIPGKATFTTAPTKGQIVTTDFGWEENSSSHLPGYTDGRKFTVAIDILKDFKIEKKHLSSGIIEPAHIHDDYVLNPKTVSYVLDDGADVPDGYTVKEITLKDGSDADCIIKIDGTVGALRLLVKD